MYRIRQHCVIAKDWNHLNIQQLLLFSHSVMSHSFQPHALQHARLPCPSLSPRACSNSCPSSWWGHPTSLSSAIPFSCLQSFPASGSFLMSHLFTSGGQSIGVSASASLFPMNIRDWFPLGLTGLISLLFKGLSRIFSNTTVQKASMHYLILNPEPGPSWNEWGPWGCKI